MNKPNDITPFQELPYEEQMAWAEYMYDPVRWEQLEELERVERVNYCRGWNQ